MSILSYPSLPIAHPRWCDTRICTTFDERGTFVITHATTCLDGRTIVEVRQADEVTADGLVVSSDRPFVYCQLPDSLGPDDAVAVAGALAAAAGFVSAALTARGAR